MKTKKLIIVHTGEGKGKTTAALGMVMRTLAHGWHAAIVQFIKSAEDYKYGEAKLAEQMEQLDIFTMGDGFTWNNPDKEKNIRTALETWEKCKEVTLSGKYRLVVWDEINYAIHYGFLDEQLVLDFLQQSLDLHIVMTGRYAKPSIMEIADLVTEMTNVKHPYQAGIKAQKGVDW